MEQRMYSCGHGSCSGAPRPAGLAHGLLLMGRRRAAAPAVEGRCGGRPQGALRAAVLAVPAAGRQRRHQVRQLRACKIMRWVRQSGDCILCRWGDSGAARICLRNEIPTLGNVQPRSCPPFGMWEAAQESGVQIVWHPIPQHTRGRQGLSRRKERRGEAGGRASAHRSGAGGWLCRRPPR